MYKIGVHIANCRIILEVARRVEERAEMKKKEKETEGEGQIGKCSDEEVAFFHFSVWIEGGNKY